jgi:hypothetical protein
MVRNCAQMSGAERDAASDRAIDRYPHSLNASRHAETARPRDARVSFVVDESA